MSKRYFLKEDVYNPYREKRKIEVPAPEDIRIESKRRGREQKTIIVEQEVLFAAEGEEVFLIGDHDNVLVCANKSGERISILTDKLFIQ